MKDGQEKVAEVSAYKSLQKLLQPLENRIKSLEGKSEMAEYYNDGEMVKEKFGHFVCIINGSNGVGAGVIIDGIHIVTVNHLGFTLNEFRDVKMSNVDILQARCTWISPKADLATLQLNCKRTTDLPVDEMASGRTYYGFGFPHSSKQDTFSTTKILVEGLYSDGIHFNGVPGARGGFSGALYSRNLDDVLALWFH
jgi:hypothetical protein